MPNFVWIVIILAGTVLVWWVVMFIAVQLGIVGLTIMARLEIWGRRLRRRWLIGKEERLRLQLAHISKEIDRLGSYYEGPVKDGSGSFFRVMNARGMLGPFYALDLGRDRLGRRVLGWFDLEQQRVMFLRPTGRWLRKQRSPRPVTAEDLDGMRRAALQHAEWQGSTASIGDFPARVQGSSLR